MKNTARTRRDKRKMLIGWCAGAAALVLCLAAAYIAGQRFEKAGRTQAYGDLNGRFQEQPIVTYDGVEYQRRAGLESYLFMGIDRREGQTDGYRSGGQCDFLMVVVLDRQNKMVRRIQIDRDTMAEITVLGVLGNNLGTNTHQICLAHGFGDGAAQSCGFAVEAVERLLCGVEMDGYVSMELDGIVALNDLLGGVTVTVEDDFSAFDPAMTPGSTLTLQGRQAELFVRYRMEIGDGTNAARMVRQQQYLANAFDQIALRLKEDAGFAAALFDGMQPYLLSDLTRGRMINEANRAAKYDIEPMRTLEGEHTIGEDGFVEFHADGEALVRLVLDVFYTPLA